MIVIVGGGGGGNKVKRYGKKKEKKSLEGRKIYFYNNLYRVMCKTPSGRLNLVELELI